MSGFVYLWFDRKRKMYYVGSHWGSENDGYICSSKWMRDAYTKRPQDFKRRIISRVTTSREDLLKEEHRYLLMIKPEELKDRYYNMKIWQQGLWYANEDQKLSIQKKISKKTKAAMARPEVRSKYEEGLEKRDNRSSDPLVREKRRQSMIQTMAEKFPNRKIVPKFGSEEYRENMSTSLKEIWQDETHQEKVSFSMKQKWKDPEYQQKIRHDGNSKTWFLNGIEISNLKKYCEDNNLQYANTRRKLIEGIPL
jgi:hypothetical protein